jgi:hypothetical protein
MPSIRVGIREFRENLSSYLESKTPVAITRHGATIGIYLPTKPKPSQAEVEALRVAGEKLDALIAAAGTSEEELMEDFKKGRAANNGSEIAGPRREYSHACDTGQGYVVTVGQVR